MKIILEFDSYKEMEAYCQKVVDSKDKKSKKPITKAGCRRSRPSKRYPRLAAIKYELLRELLEASPCLTFGGEDAAARLQEIGVDERLLSVPKDSHPLEGPVTPKRRELAAKMLEAMAALAVLSGDSKVVMKDAACLVDRAYSTVMAFSGPLAQMGATKSVQGSGTRFTLPVEGVLTAKVIEQLIDKKSYYTQDA